MSLYQLIIVSAAASAADGDNEYNVAGQQCRFLFRGRPHITYNVLVER